MHIATTDVLDIAYETGGPREGAPVLLLHGWPDDVQGWRRVTPALEQAGHRWIAPWLRGFGPTRFRSSDTPRDGTGVALAQDAFELADALGLERFAVVGHDWGGRAAYIMEALQPGRLTAVAVLAIGYSPRGRFVVPSLSQSRRWWYQWFMTTDGGAEKLRADPVGFARMQWDDWSPPGWFDEAEFKSAAESFRNPDWVDITLNGYRSRWRPEPLDARYDPLRAKVASAENLTIRTLMIQGADDRCDPPEESEGQSQYFMNGYERTVIKQAGHFPAREQPDEVAACLIRLLDGHSLARSGVS